MALRFVLPGPASAGQALAHLPPARGDQVCTCHQNPRPSPTGTRRACRLGSGIFHCPLLWSLVTVAHTALRSLYVAICGPKDSQIHFLSSYQAFHTQMGADGPLTLWCLLPTSARPCAERRSAFLGRPGNPSWGDRSLAPSQRLWLPGRVSMGHWAGPRLRHVIAGRGVGIRRCTLPASRPRPRNPGAFPVCPAGGLPCVGCLGS